MIEFYSRNRSRIVLFAAVSLLVFIIYAMEVVGIPRNYVIFLSAVFTFLLIAISSFSYGTTRVERFLTAKQQLSILDLALYVSACCVFPFILMESASVIFQKPGFLAALFGSIICGLAISALLVARPYNRADAKDLGEFFYKHYHSNFPGRILAPLSLCGTILLLASGMKFLILLLGWFFAISPQNAAIASMFGVGASVILGGQYSVTRIGAMSAFLFIVTLNFVLFLFALEAGGLPIGQLTFGSDSLPVLWDFEDQLQSLQIAKLSDILSGHTVITDWSSDITMLACGVIGGALIAYPPILQAFGSAKTRYQSGQTNNYAILLVGLIFLTLFTLLIFSGLGFYQTMLGLRVDNARIVSPVLYAWEGHLPPLVTLCNSIISHPEELLRVCANNAKHLINTNDLAINAWLFWIAAPDFNGFPVALTAIVSIAAIVFLIGFNSSLVLSGANTIGGAYYANTKKATGSRQVFWNRVFATLIIFCVVIVSTQSWFNPTTGSLLGLSILISTALPAILIAIYLPKVGQIALSTTISVGFAGTVLFYVLASYGVDLVGNSNDEIKIGLFGMSEAVPGYLGGIFGLLAAVIIVAISLLISIFSPAETNPDQQSEADTI